MLSDSSREVYLCACECKKELNLVLLKKKKKSQLLFLNWLQYLTVSLWKVLVCTLKMLLLFCLNHLEINWECVRATELLYHMFYVFSCSDLA